MKILFVGENRSPSAIRMDVTWEDKRLAAKQLFDAFDALEVDHSEFKFTNVKEPEDFLTHLEVATEEEIPIVGMGRVVQQILNNMNIIHIPMIHPAARGSIRKKERYAEHVNGVLKEVAEA
tara:strand:- start:84 stop:446 length:363 start_codon:yes stop_codon:yes gene_type:complete